MINYLYYEHMKHDVRNKLHKIHLKTKINQEIKNGFIQTKIYSNYEISNEIST